MTDEQRKRRLELLLSDIRCTTGLTKKAAMAAVAPEKRKEGDRVDAGLSRDFAILSLVFGNHPERDWFPPGEPDAFVVRKVFRRGFGPSLCWHAVFGKREAEFSYKRGFAGK